MHLFILNYPVHYTKRLVIWLQGKWQCTCVMWRINWALTIYCNPRVPLGANKLVSKVWMKTDDQALQKIYEIRYSFCILVKSFARPFEIKWLPIPRSCSQKYENHLFMISNDEKWLSLKKIFWKIYHHFQCFSWYYTSFVFSTSTIFNKLGCKFESFFTEELKSLSSSLIRYVHLFILDYTLKYAKRLAI